MSQDSARAALASSVDLQVQRPGSGPAVPQIQPAPALQLQTGTGTASAMMEQQPSTSRAYLPVAPMHYPPNQMHPAPNFFNQQGPSWGPQSAAGGSHPYPYSSYPGSYPGSYPNYQLAGPMQQPPMYTPQSVSCTAGPVGQQEMEYISKGTAEVKPWDAKPSDASTVGAGPSRPIKKAKFTSDEDTCTICFSKKKDLRVLLHCGHFPFCTECLRSSARGMPSMRCSVCRKISSDSVAIFKVKPVI